MATPPPSKHTLITTLADVYCYQASGQDHATVSSSGVVRPAKTHKKTFPRALKRLRDRLRLLEDRLTLDANALRQEVMDLELKKSLLENKLHSSEARRRQRITSVVKEYFSVFQVGWTQSTTADTLGPGEIEGSVNAATPTLERLLDRQQRTLLADRQRQFLASSVDPRIRDHVAACWQSLTEDHGPVRLDLDRVECAGARDAPIVVASGQLIGQLNPAMLSRIDTSVSRDHELIKSLLGTTIPYPCRLLCQFSPSGEMLHHALELDHVVALQKVLGKLVHVHSVVDACRQNTSRSW